VPTNLSILAQQLRSAVLDQTGRRVWNLAVEISAESVVLRGNSSSFYAKQLAQESVRRMLPALRLVNAINVAA
jgi:hypothetical protein